MAHLTADDVAGIWRYLAFHDRKKVCPRGTIKMVLFSSLGQFRCALRTQDLFESHVSKTIPKITVYPIAYADRGLIYKIRRDPIWARCTPFGYPINLSHDSRHDPYRPSPLTYQLDTASALILTQARWPNQIACPAKEKNGRDVGFHSRRSRRRNGI